MREGDGAVNNQRRLYFGGSSSAALLTVSECDRAGRPLTCSKQTGLGGQGGLPSSVLGDGVMSLGSGVEK